MNAHGNRRRKRAVGLLTLGLVSSFVAPGLADEYHGINAGAPVWDSLIYFDDAKAADIAATGCQAVRINFRMDGHSTWDTTILAIYDLVIQNAVNHQLVVLGLLCNECMPVGQTAWNDDPDGNGMNQYVIDYSETALLLIDRYKDRIKRWELWNEPNAYTNPDYRNDPQNAGGTYILPRVYANLLAETYLQCDYYDNRSILTDNGITLVTGGLLAYDGMTGMSYMQEVYDRHLVWDQMQASVGRRYPWDHFGYHFYVNQSGAVSTYQLWLLFEGWPWTDSVRRVQDANGDTTPVLVTEFGWNTLSVSETQQRDNMHDTYEWLESKAYVAGTYWYQWQDEPAGEWGIVRGPGFHKLSYDEFSEQNGDPPPPPPPEVTIAADRTDVFVGHSVHFTPSVTLAYGATAVESVWHFGPDEVIVPGMPEEIDRVFDSIGDYNVWLVVTDSNDNAGTSNSVTIHVTVPEHSAADFDRDGDVDQADFGHLQTCFSGEGVHQNDPACLDTRLDPDLDVDRDDLGVFQECISGPGVPADPWCGHPL